MDFGIFQIWDFCWINPLFLKLIIGFCWYTVIFMIFVEKFGVLWKIKIPRACIELDLGILFNWVKIDKIGLLNWYNWSLNCFLTCVMINWSISLKTFKWFKFFFFLGFLLETLCSSQFCEFELNLDLIALHSVMHHDVSIIHTSYSFCSMYFFVLTCSLPLILFFFSLFFVCFWSLF